MKKRMFGYIPILVIAFASICSADYRIVWSTIDGGGGRSSGGQYMLTGTIGQPDAGHSQGGRYELLGGFWLGGPLPPSLCFVDFDSLSRFVQQWLYTGTGLAADLNHDDKVNFRDYAILAGLWLDPCPPDWPLR
jgi:hypothetical protein